eukprot:Tbor_TRINITY_DN6109_c3_g1::TRINITY_DN6109_c3_g1_i5::g.22915::m.22915
MGCGKSSPANKDDLWVALKSRIPDQRNDVDAKKRTVLFEKFDENKKKSLSENECLTGCKKHLELDKLADNLKDINSRAFKASSSLRTRPDATSGVDPAEFRLYLMYLRKYFDLHALFNKIDKSGNKIVSNDEFTKAVPMMEKCGVKIDDPETAFKKIDKDGKGVNFDEFSEWAIHQNFEVKENVILGKPMVEETSTAESRKSFWTEIQARLPRGRTPEELEARDKLFKQFDPNNNGYLSLSEVYAGCSDILEMKKFTENLYPIVIKAFNKAKDVHQKRGKGSDRGGDFIERVEFRLLLVYLYDYFEMWVAFDEIDTGGDHTVSLEEFRKAVPTIESWGVKIEDVDETFKTIDTSSSGTLSFSEFCTWAIAKHLDADGSN